MTGKLKGRGGPRAKIVRTPLGARLSDAGGSLEATWVHLLSNLKAHSERQKRLDEEVDHALLSFAAFCGSAPWKIRLNNRRSGP